MADKYDKRLADIERRVSNGIVIGTVSSVDHEKGRYRVKAGELETDWIPMATPRAGKTSIYSSYEEGEQVILASQSGDLSQAVILGAVATGETQAGTKGNTHVIKYPDGTTVEYDHEAKSYKMDVAEGGAFSLNIGGGASITGSGDGLKIKAGSIELESATLTHNGKNIGDDHTHKDVTRGTDETGPPA
ncbi:phage baseplate assembly protein V [Neorhizobium sp. T786]|uniref:phage baseplate assembly protein V n=1 Tax=Pseudorhizobium xiangyangii TaxID=2883104 RepID=UPI001D001592|nr:phage baseplate assembly protein V [Neorhizobium xiangyangii]MCB5201718.1 phage baseplate assembly protein V [Neorhizobium xiangyangii]